MHSSHNSPCVYGQTRWRTPAGHSHSLEYTDFRLNRVKSGSGNSYAACQPRQHGLVFRDRQQMETVGARALDDVTSGEYEYVDVSQSGAVIARRNERERNRVKTINQTFARLRQHLPSSVAAAVTNPTATPSPAVTKAKKLSKVQILRAAIQYIGQLQQLLMTCDDVSLSTGSIIDAEYRSMLNLEALCNDNNNKTSESGGVELNDSEHYDITTIEHKSCIDRWRHSPCCGDWAVNTPVIQSDDLTVMTSLDRDVRDDASLVT